MIYSLVFSDIQVECEAPQWGDANTTFDLQPQETVDIIVVHLGLSPKLLAEQSIRYC